MNTSFSRPPEVQGTNSGMFIETGDTDGCITHSAHSGVGGDLDAELHAYHHDRKEMDLAMKGEQQ